MDELRRINELVSKPKGDFFGQYLTTQQVKELVGQPEEVHNQIKQWAESESKCAPCDLSVRSGAHGDYVFVETCVARLQCLFKAKFSRIERHGRVTYRTEQVMDNKDMNALNVPQELHPYIQRVMHVTEDPVELRRHIKRESSGFQGKNIDPNLIRTNYGLDKYDLPDDPSQYGPQGKQAAGEFQYDYWFPSDLIKMQKRYNRPENNVSTIIGTDDPDSFLASLDEASLDFQYITTVESLETWAFVQSGFTFDLVEYCETVAATEGAPLVHSLSYGATELQIGYDTAFRSNDEFMKLTTQGFTFLASSGDSGPATDYYGCPSFDPSFPATSLYVTSVGATYLKNNDGDQCSIYFSGSGFSNLFARPSYQDPYVEKFFETSQMPSSYLYNSSGRGIPDLSAYGTNFQVRIEGSYEPVAGTSASCPLVAALVGYGNAQRAANGLSPLGNINPRLYETGNVGTDITCGQSIDEGYCTQGYYACEGWDAATGLGTPLGDVFFPLLTQD